MPSPLSTLILYLASGANIVSVIGHTQMGYNEHFPPLKALGPRNASAEVMKNGWLSVNVTYVMMAILTAKWAHTGLTDPYEKAMFACAAVMQAYMGTRYIKIGIYKPLFALWFAPGLVAGSLLV
ncbi:hypothetical protein MMC30_007051 [Trapelia coarctata]|nr:hypothetical protein [Trapelia coarctata]